jgi:alpha-L-fucosidase
MSILCAALPIGFALVSLGQSAGEQQSASSPIPYANLQPINDQDTDATILEKAAKVLPRPNQSAWMRLERTFFIHFGPNTFRGVEWGNGREDPSIFNPTQLDADQWMRAVKDGGGKLVILVCKHHDGFALWPTRYTEHSVAASPWRGGKGNLVREVADAAHKYGIELGVYLSPADLYQLRTNPTNPAGYYGDGSPKLPSTIPTNPASFKSDPSQRRTSTAGFESYSYQVDDYNRYFLNQLYELLTEYGPIREVWFDGANPDPSVPESYDYNAWYDLIRKLQPNAVIAVKGPDVRWVGNESGVGRTAEWSVIPLSRPPEQFTWPDMTGDDLASRSKLVPGTYLWWYPAEVNEPILYGWFWHPRKYVRTAADLIEIYYNSVGRNGNMLLNLSPDTRGLIPDNQLAHLRLMSRVIGQTFENNLATDGRLVADSSSESHAPARALDGDLDTWWEAASGARTAVLTLTLPEPRTFDVVSLQEAVDLRSQRIEHFFVDVWERNGWKQVDEQTTVGHKRLLRWSTPVTTDRVRIRIASARLEPALAEIGLFKQAAFLPAPAISERDASGQVTVGAVDDLAVVFTVDGSAPSASAPRVHGPVELRDGGTLQAAALGPDALPGLMAARLFAGFAPAGFQIAGVDSEDVGAEATNAIDAKSATLWEAHTPATAARPHWIAVDMGSPRKIGGFAYLPRQDKSRDGVVENFRIDTSLDGEHWTPALESGGFWNVVNNPVQQVQDFPAVEARYFRMTVLKDAGGKGLASAAEISVLPVPAVSQH